MTVNVGKFELEISKKIAATTDSRELLMLTNALKQIKSGPVDYVSTYASLPSASANRGKLFMVDSECLVYWSTGSNWISIKNSVGIGKVYAWGLGGYGALGIGNTTSQVSPVTTAGGGTNWCFVSGGYKCSSAAIKTDGTLWMWGYNANGQLGTGNTTNYSSPVTTAGGGTTWYQVSGNGCHTISIKTDGTLWTWGNNTYGQLGTGDTTSTSSPVTTLGGGTNWCKVSTGICHSVALKLDGTLNTWGDNSCGQLGTGNITNYSSPITIAGGGTTWCQVSSGVYKATGAIKTDGTLWVWGQNRCGLLGTNNTTNYSSPVTTIGGGTTWRQVSIGGYTSGAIKTDGTLWMWGKGGQGGLGTGSVTDYSSPVTTAGGGTNWCNLYVAFDKGFAIKTDGTLWSWGYNNCGQLGNGNFIAQSSPVSVVGGITNWCQVSGSANILGLTRTTY